MKYKMKCSKCFREIQKGDNVFECIFGSIKESEMEELGLVFKKGMYTELICLRCHKF